MLLTYQPRAVFIPPDLARKHADLLRHPADSRPADLAADEYVLFHDVFRTVADDKILAIGAGWRDTTHLPKFSPVKKSKQVGWQKKPLYELRDDLAPLSFKSGEKQLVFSYKTIYGHTGQRQNQRYVPILGVYEIEMTPTMQRQDAFHLKIAWRDFQVELKIPRSKFKLAQTEMTLNAIQRGSQPEWVADWCRYYYREHGVKRFVLYNNLDDNGRTIVEQLAALPDDVEIFYIEWPYRFTFEAYFNMAQPVQINHCLQMFGASSRYYLNFDLDEYLVNTTKTPLLKFLDAQTGGRRRSAALSVRPWQVPAISDTLRDGEVPRAWHFKHCLWLGAERGSQKIISRSERIQSLWLHNATPNWQRGRGLLKNWLICQILEITHLFVPYFGYTKPIVPKRLVFFAPIKRVAKVPLIGIPLRKMLRLLDRFIIKPPDLFFYHYEALGNERGWRRRSKLSERPRILATHPIKKSQIYD